MLYESILAFPWVWTWNCCVQSSIFCSFCCFFKLSHLKRLILVDQLGLLHQLNAKSSSSCITEWPEDFFFLRSTWVPWQSRYLCSPNLYLCLFPGVHRAFAWLEVQAGLGWAGIPAFPKQLHDLFRQMIFPGHLYTGPQGSQEIALGSGEAYLGEKGSNSE